MLYQTIVSLFPFTACASSGQVGEIENKDFNQQPYHHENQFYITSKLFLKNEDVIIQYPPKIKVIELKLGYDTKYIA